jgi:sugar/nucleoside kinase (ribokinase family)
MPLRGPASPEFRAHSPRRHPVRQRGRDHPLYQTKSFDEAARHAQADTKLAALTRSEKGSIILGEGKSIAIPAAPVAKVVDTTGAGDLYAAGFLYGVAAGRDLETSGRLGSLAAAEIISHIGARPEVSLKKLAREKGLLA